MSDKKEWLGLSEEDVIAKEAIETEEVIDYIGDLPPMHPLRLAAGVEFYKRTRRPLQDESQLDHTTE